MPFAVSPDTRVNEFDLTTTIPAVATTEAGIAGIYKWGPIEQPILCESETEYRQRFGTPGTFNFETWFTGANFLAYSNKLYVVRAANTSETLSALANVGTVTANSTTTIKNSEDYDTRSSFDANIAYIARYAGAMGNSLKISVCDSANAYTSNLYTSVVNAAAVSANLSLGSNSVVVVTGNTSDAALFANVMTVGDIVRVGNSTTGFNELKVAAFSVNGSNVNVGFTSITTISLSANVSVAANVGFTRFWEFYNVVDKAPGTSKFVSDRGGTSDELHIVVVDEDGLLSSVQNNILEVYEGASRATDALSEGGGSNYYVSRINQSSEYIWWANHRAGSNAVLAATSTGSTNSKPLTISFAQGADGVSTESNVAISSVLTAYDKFKNSEEIDISLILSGKARGGTYGEQLPNYIIDNIASVRKDCVVFVSAPRSAVVQNSGEITTSIVQFRNALHNTSYAFLDSGYKYMYDRYNDVNRFVPLNGDIAGLAAQTDYTRDPWWSFAGFNRGFIKNVIKLAYNPSKADRDILYKSDINPVVTFPGQGTVLYGDKTLLGKPSAFDRINVRRLFIVLEKAIATAAKFTLFEFNDEFTRAQFRNMVEPFLRDVQGRRGIYAYRVVCDDSNNPGSVIDRNEFVGDIYIKPARSINFITLNFIAVGTAVEFSEVVGGIN
jgi:hypothetical protein